MCRYVENGIVFSNSRHNWIVKGGKYRFEFEKNNPKIYFEDVDLACMINNKNQSRRSEKYSDSSVVYKTSGVYQPFINKWEGRGGTVNWAKTGLDPIKTLRKLRIIQCP